MVTFRCDEHLVFVECRKARKGNGYYVRLGHPRLYVSIIFYSQKNFSIPSGSVVVPIIEAFDYKGNARFRLIDLEIVK